jgi:hypothetical protein
MKSEENFIIEENIENHSQEKSLGAITNSYYNDENSEEISKINISNNREIINEKSTEQIKDNLNNSSKFHDSNFYKDNLLQSEEIFMNQKKEIQRMREKNLYFLAKKNNKILNNKINEYNTQKNNNTKINESQNITEKDFILDNNNNKNNGIIFFTLNDYQYFEVSLFDYSESDEEKFQIPEINEPWKPSLDIFSYYSKGQEQEKLNNFIEINRIALRTNQEIDYSIKGLELIINFSLLGKSELFIFTRSSVNKGINESYFFDEKSVNIEEEDIFNKYSSVIKITKEKNSNKCFVIFGTFCQDQASSKLYYKSFLKRQLIDYSDIQKSIDYYYFNENDKCDFEIRVTDFGEEIINTKVFLNNKNKYNDINGTFFLPINKKAKFLICGTGKSVQIKDLNVKIHEKDKRNFKSIIQLETENDVSKNCECCSIF